jgi:hypothetical protein
MEREKNNYVQLKMNISRRKRRSFQQYCKVSFLLELVLKDWWQIWAAKALKRQFTRLFRPLLYLLRTNDRLGG